MPVNPGTPASDQTLFAADIHRWQLGRLDGGDSTDFLPWKVFRTLSKETLENLKSRPQHTPISCLTTAFQKSRLGQMGFPAFPCLTLLSIPLFSPMKTFAKVSRFFVMSFWSIVFADIIFRRPEFINILAIASSILMFILVYPFINNWWRQSLNNLAHTIMIFLSLPFIIILLFKLYNIDLDLDAIQVFVGNYFGDLSEINENRDRILEMFKRALVVILFMPRFLSLYSGALLCWKLVKSHDQGGPYSQLSRLYQGTAVIFWLLELALLLLSIIFITFIPVY